MAKLFRVIFCFKERNDNVEQFSIVVDAPNEDKALAVGFYMLENCVPKRAVEIRKT